MRASEGRSLIGIRREDKNRWERRAPLTPDHVAELVRAHDVRFQVEPSALRIFPDLDYRTAGAEVGEDLASCRTILGIKEMPAERILPEKTYFFFSHTVKGQAHNMPMLRRIADLGATLVDYERIVDERGKRLVFFGRHAGHAGMIDALWALGQRLAHEGHLTGLEAIRLAHEYSSLDEATHHLARVGERLRHTGIPEALHPLVFVFTGSGNVTRGALEIFDRLPVQDVLAEDLPSLASDPERPHNVLFRVHLARADRYERLDLAAFSEVDFASRPQDFKSTSSRWLPHTSVLVNGALWTPEMPRLVSREDLRAIERDGAVPRLRVLADLACDLDGGIEATVRATTPGDPVYTFDPHTGQTPSGVTGRGPVVLAIDNLPCELPTESSEHFGDSLVRYMPAVSRCAWEGPLDELVLPAEILRAVIVYRGKLTPRYAHLASKLSAAGSPGGSR